MSATNSSAPSAGERARRRSARTRRRARSRRAAAAWRRRRQPEQRRVGLEEAARMRLEGERRGRRAAPRAARSARRRSPPGGRDARRRNCRSRPPRPAAGRWPGPVAGDDERLQGEGSAMAGQYGVAAARSRWLTAVKSHDGRPRRARGTKPVYPVLQPIILTVRHGGAWPSPRAFIRPWPCRHEPRRERRLEEE